MHQRISAAVYQLRANGVVSGDRVLITMMPSIDFYALAVAAFSIGKQQALSRECIHCGCERAGGCLVVLDPSMGLERANHCIGTAAPSAWVMPSGSWFKYLKVHILCGGGLYTPIEQFTALKGISMKPPIIGKFISIYPHCMEKHVYSILAKRYKRKSRKKPQNHRKSHIKHKPHCTSHTKHTYITNERQDPGCPALRTGTVGQRVFYGPNSPYTCMNTHSFVPTLHDMKYLYLLSYIKMGMVVIM